MSKSQTPRPDTTQPEPPYKVGASAPLVPAEGSMPNCWECRHMGITYVTHQPYLCRSMGIKTRALPGIEVLRADGRPCQGFEPKKVSS